MQPGTPVLALAPGLSPRGTCCSLPWGSVSAAPALGWLRCVLQAPGDGEKGTGVWQQANLSQPLDKEEQRGAVGGSMAAHVPSRMAAPKTSSAEPSIRTGHSGLHWELPIRPLPLWPPLEVPPWEEELQPWTG